MTFLTFSRTFTWKKSRARLLSLVFLSGMIKCFCAIRYINWCCAKAHLSSSSWQLVFQYLEHSCALSSARRTCSSIKPVSGTNIRPPTSACKGEPKTSAQPISSQEPPGRYTCSYSVLLVALGSLSSWNRNCNSSPVYFFLFLHCQLFYCSESLCVIKKLVWVVQIWRYSVPSIAAFMWSCCFCFFSFFH